MVTEGLHELVLSLIPPADSPKIILNVGCEDFHQKNYRFPENYTVYNCDINPAKAGAPNFKLCDLNQPWPYPSDWADVVLSVEVIEHLENPWHHFREARRVLKSGGILILTTPNILAPVTLKLWPYFNWFTAEDWERGEHINPIPVFEIRFICKKLNFPIEKELYHPPDSKLNLVVACRKP